MCLWYWWKTVCTCGPWLDIIDAWFGNLTFENNASIYKSNDISFFKLDKCPLWFNHRCASHFTIYNGSNGMIVAYGPRDTRTHALCLFLSLSSLLKKIAYISFSHIHFTIKSNGFRWVTLELFFLSSTVITISSFGLVDRKKRQWKTQFLHNINNIFVCNLFFVAVIYLLLPFLWYFFFCNFANFFGLTLIMNNSS